MESTRTVKLWVDDERQSPEGWTAARTASEAIAFLRTNEVCELSLDHDLGPPEAGTGYEVACWVEEHAEFGHLEPLGLHVHSANPVGRKRIGTALGRASAAWTRWREDPLWSPSVTVEGTVVTPCTVVKARYLGGIEGGIWLAFPLTDAVIPRQWRGDSPKAVWFWMMDLGSNVESARTRFVGRGDTPDAARSDLVRRLAVGRGLSGHAR